MFNNRLFWQIWLTASFVALIGAAGLYLALSSQLQTDYYARAERQLEAQLPSSAAVAVMLLRKSQVSLDQTAWHGTQNRLTVIRADGTVVFDSGSDAVTMENHGTRPEVLQAHSHGKGSAIRYSDTLGVELYYLAQSISEDGGLLGYVRVATPVTIIDAELDSALARLAFFLLLTVTLLLGVSYFLSGRFYRPLQAASAYARELAEGRYGARLPGLGDDAISKLEQSLNELARETQERVHHLEANRNQLAGLLSALKEGVIALDPQQRIQHINQSAMTLLSLQQEVVGRTYWEYIRVPQLTNLVDRVADVGLEQSENMTVAKRMLDVGVGPLGGSSGLTGGMIIVLQDVTERYQLESIRVDFVANASHELKTPLAVIKGLVETIIDDPEMPGDIRTDFLHKISTQSDRLHKIVEELFQLSRFDRYQQEDQSFVALNFVQLVGQAVGAQEGYASDQNITIVLASDQESIDIMGDREALSQLVVNLLDNAVKYSEPGGTIEVKIIDSPPEIVLEVSDQGPGIPVEDQQRIFERFYRVDPARSRAMGGTGLGLSIVKHIAGFHDGTIEVQSEPGDGATFRLRLPHLSR